MEASIAKQKKTILFFPFNLLSHYLRCLVLADRYNKDEYAISFLHSEKYAPFIERHGYNTFTCKQFDADNAIACSVKFNFSWLNEADIEQVYLSQLTVIRKLQPDIVIGDVAPALKMAAEKADVEYVALTNGYMAKHYTFTRNLSRAHPAYWFLKTLPDKLADKITAFAEKQAFVKVHEPFKAIRKRYELKQVADYLSEMEGDRNLICDLPQLFPQSRLPDNYSFIDPLIYKSTDTEVSWLDEIDDAKPIICVCMGSTGNWKSLRFLNGQEYSAYTIITAGDENNELSAPNVIARQFVNLECVLEKAALMICHGGNGTIYYGLMKGTFMLCVTSHFEQQWNVQALERIGYGKSANGLSQSEWDVEIQQALSKKPLPYF